MLCQTDWLKNKVSLTWADPEGGDREEGSGPPPPENSQNIGFLSKTGLDPLENHKATELAFIVVPYRPTSDTPFKWCFAGGPVMARL